MVRLFLVVIYFNYQKKICFLRMETSLMANPKSRRSLSITLRRFLMIEKSMVLMKKNEEIGLVQTSTRLGSPIS